MRRPRRLTRALSRKVLKDLLKTIVLALRSASGSLKPARLIVQMTVFTLGNTRGREDLLVRDKRELAYLKEEAKSVRDTGLGLGVKVYTPLAYYRQLDYKVCVISDLM